MIAFDQSDISKEFVGRGMEGMARGYDGSRAVQVMTGSAPHLQI